jgi:hypothetical protein
MKTFLLVLSEHRSYQCNTIWDAEGFHVCTDVCVDVISLNPQDIRVSVTVLLISPSDTSASCSYILQ